MVDKGNHRHFMAKEIYEQPETISHTLSHYVDMGAEKVGAARDAAVRFRQAVAGSPSRPAAPPTYAGLVAKYWFERYARLPVDVDVASEFRYREPPLETGRAEPVHLAVGRDRRHAGGAALLRRAGPARRLAAQFARIHHGPREPGGVPDPVRPRDRRRLHQGVHRPADGPRQPRDRRRRRPRRPRPRRRRPNWCAALVALPSRRLGGAGHRRRRSRTSPSACPRPRTCSIWAAARCSRSPWKAR